MYVHINIYIYITVCIYIYIYITGWLVGYTYPPSIGMMIIPYIYNYMYIYIYTHMEKQKMFQSAPTSWGQVGRSLDRSQLMNRCQIMEDFRAPGVLESKRPLISTSDLSRCRGFWKRIYPHEFGFFMGSTNVSWWRFHRIYRQV